MIGLARQGLEVSRIWHIDVLYVIMCHIARLLGVLVAAGGKIARGVNSVDIVEVVSGS